MSATELIDQIKRLPPNDQVEVIRFALELARTRPLTGKELTSLAERLAESEDPAEIARLKTSIAGGFYGN